MADEEWRKVHLSETFKNEEAGLIPSASMGTRETGKNNYKESLHYDILKVLTQLLFMSFGVLDVFLKIC